MIRNPIEEELDEIIDLLDSCFRTEREYFELFVREKTSFPDNALVAVEGKEIIGYLQIYPRFVRTRTGKMFVGGVGNVAVRRDFRRRGVASSLLQEATKLMKKRDMDFSILFASKRELYEKNGWKPLFTEIFKFRIDRKTDLALKTFSSVEEIPKKLFERIVRIHESFNEGYPLTVVRNDYLWKFQMDYIKRKMIVSEDGKAYVIYSRSFDRSFLLEDAAYEDELSFLNLVESVGGEFTFVAFSSHPVSSLLRKHATVVKSEPFGEIFVKLLKITFDTLFRELGVNEVDRRWHYWRFDYF